MERRNIRYIHFIFKEETPPSCEMGHGCLWRTLVSGRVLHEETTRHAAFTLLGN